MRRIGKFYFGWGKPKAEETRVSEPLTIVCGSYEEVCRLKKMANIGRMKNVHFIHPTITNLACHGMANVVLTQSVDVNQDVGGQGKLLDLIKQRQMMFGDMSALIRL